MVMTIGTVKRAPTGVLSKPTEMKKARSLGVFGNTFI